MNSSLPTTSHRDVSFQRSSLKFGLANWDVLLNVMHDSESQHKLFKTLDSKTRYGA